ncbi:FIG137887: membrane protein related to purine degradation [hydrothermal vent metagenome]|uniref:FIG137887: membrane protein related to purine degradation n=1 Tax=hydrothermal vent metagenome TaxID=652676 RepID=A0A3B0VLY2_9ZZZZ
MEAHIIEWLNLSVRWVHMITGIAWIGASFYFIFLENNLNRTQNLRTELAGNLWAVHGGGFYYLEKYKHSPEKIPKDLHWFKWEAYFTGITGFILLFIVYYYNANLYMIDPNIADISIFQAVSIGIGTLLGGWIIYDLMCKSALVNKSKLFALVAFGLIIALTYGLNQLISAKAAYIHIGAMIGTIMVANVFFVIIPSQKTMVNAAIKGEKSDPTLGKKALTRSIHNNYMTLPVLFIMISNHFPSTFGHKNSWLVLAGLIIVGASIRHWFNLNGKGVKNYWILPFAISLLIILVIYTKPQTNIETPQTTKVVSDMQVMQIIDQHCLSCHAAQPNSTIFAQAPKGLMFDSFDSIKANKDQIKAQTVSSHLMPLGNTTNMTEKERQKLGRWIELLE